jgi:uncharacterized protein
LNDCHKLCHIRALIQFEESSAGYHSAKIWIWFFMPVFNRPVLKSVVVLALVIASAAAFAQTKEDPWAAFKLGYEAYQQGNKAEAVESYKYAAESGVPGARWKLAHMYAAGDGVPRDDLAAFHMFEQIVLGGAEAESQDESYVADAHVVLARYLTTGIAGTDIKPDPALARDLYLRAATFYGSPEAQFELGRLILDDDQESNRFKQAARWLQLAVKKGHNGAQALLGKIYFESGRTVRGLAMLTAALAGATSQDRLWIMGLQERAFALSSEADRRTAMALNQDGNAASAFTATDTGN